MKNRSKVVTKRLERPPQISSPTTIKANVSSKKSTSAGTESSDYPNFIEELRNIRTGLNDMEKQHRVSLTRNLTAAYKVAKGLKVNFIAWSGFLSTDWGDLRKPKVHEQKKNALKHVLRWLCGSTKDGQKKASFYNRALGPLFESDLEAHTVMMKIRTDGLRKLAEQHSASKEKKPKPKYLEPIERNKRNKRWCVTMDVEFDRRPFDLIGLSGQVGFEMSGRVLETSGKRLKVLGWKFEKKSEF